MITTIRFGFFLCLFWAFSGQVFSQENNISAALQKKINEYNQNYQRFLREGDSSTAGHYVNKIAFLYWEMAQWQEAVKYFEQSRRLYRKTHHYNAVALANSYLATIYLTQRSYAKALETLNQNIQYYQKTQNKEAVANTLVRMGGIYHNQSQYSVALQKYDSAFKISQQLQHTELLQRCREGLALAYEKTGNQQKAMEMIQQFDRQVPPAAPQSSLGRAKLEEAELWVQMLDADRKEKESMLKDKEKELEMKMAELQKIENEIRDLSDEKDEMEKVTRKQKDQIAVMNTEKNLSQLQMKEKEMEIESERLMRNSVLVGSVLLLAWVVAMYLGFHQKRLANQKLALQNAEINQQKEEISVQRDAIVQKTVALEVALTEINLKNHKIRSSINYAQRIQIAILPAVETLQKSLTNSFVLFKPRDVVSGDFYWFLEKDFQPILGSKTNSAGKESTVVRGFQSEKMWIAAVDCTGHGVPGAFMSMIGTNFLNEIVNVREIHEVDLILNELHKHIRKTLKQEEMQNQDGMDMSLCFLNRKTHTLDFAGAKNGLFYLQGEKSEYIKGDKYSIGGLQKEDKRLFNKHSIHIHQNSQFYLFSDGFADQFGGEHNRKFSERRLLELLKTNSQKPMSEQKMILEETFSKWKGVEFQIDDVLVIGFEVKA